jgi:hypothetical protein
MTIDNTIIPKSDMISEQLKKDIEKAERVQKQMRKDAPKGIRVGKAYVDPRETLVRRLVPEAFWQGKPTSDKGQGRKGSIPPTLSTYFDRPDRHRQNIAKGYVPVIEEGEHVQQSGDLLYKRPIEFQKMEIDDASARSHERMDSMDHEAKADGLVESMTESKVRIGSSGEEE